MKQPARSQSKKQHSLHFIAFSTILFLVIFIVSSLAFLLSMRHSIRVNNGNELTRMLEAERTKLETSVNSKIAIILKMAESPLIVRYFDNPANPDLKDITFEEIAAYFRALSESVFWINDSDKLFYFGDREPYVLNPDLPENYWYNMTLYDTETYNFNINYNPDLNVINLWINAPVFNKKHKPIGMVGSGVDVSVFLRKIFEMHDGKADLYFFNEKGEITGAKEIEHVVAKTNIEDLLGHSAGILAMAKALHPGETRTFDSALGRGAVGTVPALEWYSVAIKPDSIDAYMNHVTVVFLSMLAVIALIIFIFNVFIAYFLKSLHKTMDSLEATSRYKSEFLARMSHEIRTPMNAILGMAELALREKNFERTQEHLYTIKKSGTNLLSIINDILDFSKIESGKLEIVPVDYLFSSLIDDVTNIINIKVQESQLEFRVDIDDTIPKALFGDEARVRQVVLNIINNAVKYTSEGFVALSAKCREVDADNMILIIEVADSGRGIKAEDLDGLFKDFVQLDRGANKGIEGTGLGLAITQNLIAAMSGDISVRSEYGKGSTFTVTLPQGISHKEPLAFDSTILLFNAPSARVLVVDDVVINRTVAKGLLTMYAMQVHTCESGEEAVKAVQAEEYDIVFMDHMMPGMDGVEATAAIRSLEGERFQTLPIVALTANAIAGVEEMFLTSGFSDYLSKPINSRKLNEMLRKWIPEKKQSVSNINSNGVAAKME